jgi:hypothetical protein
VDNALRSRNPHSRKSKKFPSFACSTALFWYNHVVDTPFAEFDGARCGVNHICLACSRYVLRPRPRDPSPQSQSLHNNQSFPKLNFKLIPIFHRKAPRRTIPSSRCRIDFVGYGRPLAKTDIPALWHHPCQPLIVRILFDVSTTPYWLRQYPFGEHPMIFTWLNRQRKGLKTLYQIGSRDPSPYMVATTRTCGVVE